MTSSPNRAQSPRRRGRVSLALLVVLIIAVPLAVAGFFVGSLAQASDRVDRIPALVVNNDEMLDGDSDAPVFAGRGLVTELTGDDAPGFDWEVSNAEDADAALADGDAYAVLTIPEDFSKSITSMQSDDPVTADVSVQTDEKHDYLTASAVDAVTQAMARAFGSQITQQYLETLYSNLGDLTDSFDQAADGAAQLADGASDLADGTDGTADGARSLAEGTDGVAGAAGQLAGGATDLADGAHGLADGTSDLAGGLDQLASGAAQSSSGADRLADGIGDYTAGVSQVAAGLGELADQTDQLGQLASGAEEYVGGVSDLAEAIGAANDLLQSDDPAQQAQGRAMLAQAAPALGDVAAQGDALAQGTAALPALHDALNQAREGADELADSSGQLTTGANGLSSGLDQLATGLKQSASGAHALDGGAASLADGADALADGAHGLAGGADDLADGAHQLADGTSDLTDGAHDLADGADEYATKLADGVDEMQPLKDAVSHPSKRASVAAEPVSADVEKQHPLSSFGVGIGVVALPIALWIGALAIFALLRPVTRSGLTSTAPTARLVRKGFARAGLLAAAQVVPLVLVVHLGLGVSWSLVWATTLFSAVTAAAFVSIHFALTALFGRAGIVVSTLLAALQLAVAPGLMPSQLAATPFATIASVLPLGHAVRGMQAILAGGGGVWSAVAVLVVWGLVGAAVVVWRISRQRTPAAAAGASIVA